MTTCPRCDGTLQDTTWGDKYCPPCGWYYASLADTARTWHEWTPRNAFNTPYGLCKGFDRDDRGGGGRSDF